MPAGTSGPVTLTFAPNSPYRAGLVGGLALLPLLALMAWWPARQKPVSPPTSPRCAPVGAPGGGRLSRCWRPGQ